MEEDDDTYTGESEDDTSENEWKTEKIQHHRKNHFWSLTEVMNLVQGVSKYGVGRWIQIKRLFFRSSPHRTPADLKDKWRNLLSASCGRSQKRRQVRPRQNGIPHSIPQHILHWVRDLAAIHPYPRKKVMQTAPSRRDSNTGART
nr:Telomere repeat-binding protein [Ipomoea batatas]